MTFTYYVSGFDTINQDVLIEGLKKRGWKQYEKKNRDYVDALIVFASEKKALKFGNKYIRANLKNVINEENKQISDKWILHQKLQKAYPNNNFMPETFLLNKDFKVEKNKIYILKSVIARKGAGIFVIKSQQNLENKMKYYENGNKLFNVNNVKNENKQLYRYLRSAYKKDNRVIISEYLLDTLLFNEKKFHLRMYFLTTILNGKLETFLFKEGRIMTADRKFDIKNVSNKSSYNTHLTTTNRDYLFSNSFSPSITKNLFDQMKHIMKSVSVTFKDDLRCYDENKNCYQLFGLDFMVMKNLDVKLIEINSSNTGFASISEEITQYFNHIIFDTVLEDIIDPLFYNKKPTYKYVDKLL